MTVFQIFRFFAISRPGWKFVTLTLKAMLHEAIFLATCNATMTNKKNFKLQRGCHTFAIFFATCNAYNNKQDDGNLSRANNELWLAHSEKNCVESCWGDVTRMQLSVSQRCEKLRVVLLFLQLATQQLQLQNGVLHANLFSQLATQRLLRCKLQGKIVSCNKTFKAGVHLKAVF